MIWVVDRVERENQTAVRVTAGAAPVVVTE